MKKPIRNPSASLRTRAQGKHFYSHIIETSTVSLALGDMELSQDERRELISLAHDNLHHAILDTVLSELSEDDKKIFLQHVAFDDHAKIWDLLGSKVKNIEEKIQKVAEDVKKELHQDIKDARK